MTSPTDRARNSDRDAAIKTVDAALAAGRIVQADRDKRVTEIQRSQTMQDIQTQIGDLTTAVAAPVIMPVSQTPPGIQSPTVSAGTSTGTPGQAQWPLVNYGSGGVGAGAAGLTTISKKASRGIGGIVAAIVLVAVVLPIVGAVIAFASARNSFDFGSIGPTDDQTYLPGQTPGAHGVNLFTPAGFNKLLAAVKEKTGGTMVYDAVIYPRYAVVEMPDLSGPGHYENFYWNGKSLELEDIKGTTDDAQVDLSKLDPAAMINCVKKVRARITNPTSWYAIAEASDGPALGNVGQMSCYSSNEYDDTSYIVLRFDGTLVFDSATEGVQPSPPASPSPAG